ncbi:HalOD1 output domain-containing protein [Halobaculum limi]|uniref:HalOD1 output domain-containing protein n=1 Tax=Halobaculum limi TaxID=3031916 RepID=UPI002406D03F|nr:HalOD1 output domain-containing protein [Halobaculum sp. YSMS11]
MIEDPGRNDRFTGFDSSAVTEYPYDEDGDTEPVSVRVVESVAAATNSRAVDLSPLFETVEPDALDSLYPPHGPGGIVIAFRYEGTIVELSGPGDVVVALEDDSAAGEADESGGLPS